MEEIKKKTLPLIYVLSMPAIFIIANCIAGLYFKVTGIYFEIESANLYASVLLYPLLYLISGLIIRRTNYKDALRMMVVTLISATLAFVMQWVILDTMNANIAVYAFLSFVICELIFIYTYDFLMKKNKNTYVPLFILIFIISLIDSIFFGAFVEGTLTSASMLIRAIYIIILPAMLSETFFTVGNIEQKEKKTPKKKA